MDFIKGLPSLEGRNAITVVVDRFTKYEHFIALTHPFTAQDIAQLFLYHFYKFHGLPAVIVTDRDRIFTSVFWKEFFKKLGVMMLMSTTYHPQTDEQTKRVNQCLETYLRCMTMHQPKQWFQWLLLAQWWYNSSHHATLGMSHFQALYCYAPPQMEWLAQEPTPIAAVEEVLQGRANMDHTLKK
jgi:transposase InsO family protein